MTIYVLSKEQRISFLLERTLLLNIFLIKLRDVAILILHKANLLIYELLFQKEKLFSCHPSINKSSLYQVVQRWSYKRSKWVKTVFRIHIVLGAVTPLSCQTSAVVAGPTSSQPICRARLTSSACCPGGLVGRKRRKSSETDKTDTATLEEPPRSTAQV